MTYKLAGSYSISGPQQLMVMGCLVGHHVQLSTALTTKAVAVANMASGFRGCIGTPNLPDNTVDVEEEKDTVMLKLNHHFSDEDLNKTVMAMEAIKLIGCLLGLTHQPTTSDAPQATDTNGGGPPRPRFHGGCKPDLAMESTPFTWAMLAFLAETAQMVTWDAKEGTFPIPSTDHKEEHKTQLANEIAILCDCNPFYL